AGEHDDVAQGIDLVNDVLKLVANVEIPRAVRADGIDPDGCAERRDSAGDGDVVCSRERCDYPLAERRVRHQRKQNPPDRLPHQCRTSLCCNFSSYRKRKLGRGGVPTPKWLASYWGLTVPSAPGDANLLSCRCIGCSRFFCFSRLRPPNLTTPGPRNSRCGCKPLPASRRRRMAPWSSTRRRGT